MSKKEYPPPTPFSPPLMNIQALKQRGVTMHRETMAARASDFRSVRRSQEFLFRFFSLDKKVSAVGMLCLSVCLSVSLSRVVYNWIFLRWSVELQLPSCGGGPGGG